MRVPRFYNYYCLENNHGIDVFFFLQNVNLYIHYIHQRSCYAEDGFVLSNYCQLGKA